MSIYLIGTNLPLEILKIIESYLIAYDYRRHTWTQLSKNGNIKGLQWLRQRGIGKPSWNTFYAAIAWGSLETLQWLFAFYPNTLNSLTSQRGYYITTSIQIAISNNHFEIVKWLFERFESSIRMDIFQPMYFAATNGNLDMIQWLFNQNFQPPSSCIDEAAANGHLTLLNWYAQHCPDLIGSSTAMNFAAEYGHLEIMTWLHSHRKSEPPTSLAMEFAARSGYLNILCWLQQHYPQIECTTSAMNFAAGNGFLEIVEWLHINRTEGCTKSAMDRAATNGHLNVVKWLHSHRSEGCTTNAMDCAAERGHLEIVQWLHYNRTEGCTFRAVDWASDNGHFDVVKWLLETRTEGCSMRALAWAAEKKHFHICRWLLENKHCDWSVEFLYALAANDGFGLILSCPNLENLCKYSNEREQFLCDLVYSGNVVPFQWLALEHPGLLIYTERCILTAIAYGFIDIIEFLFNFGKSTPSAYRCFIRALTSNELKSLEWLCQKFPHELEKSYGHFLEFLFSGSQSNDFIIYWMVKFAPKYFSKKP